MDFQPLKYRFIKAEAEPASAPTLLLLHGTGGDENDLLPLGKYFGTGVNLLSVRGNVLENGMPRFFRRLSEGVFDVPDLHYRTHELVHFLEQTAKEQDIDPTRFVALGYSNGANIAGASLILYPEFLAGAILFRPMMPFAVEDPFLTNKQQPILMTSGSMDPTVRPEETKEWAEILQQNGYRVQYELVDAGHQLTQKDISLTTTWFNENFSNKSNK